jgi:hypothetical protein
MDIFDILLALDLFEDWGTGVTAEECPELTEKQLRRWNELRRQLADELDKERYVRGGEPGGE